jgi:hypothetical protein
VSYSKKLYPLQVLLLTRNILSQLSLDAETIKLNLDLVILDPKANLFPGLGFIIQQDKVSDHEAIIRATALSVAISQMDIAKKEAIYLIIQRGLRFRFLSIKLDKTGSYYLVYSMRYEADVRIFKGKEYLDFTLENERKVIVNMILLIVSNFYSFN